jgi:hypothetical protein
MSEHPKVIKQVVQPYFRAGKKKKMNSFLLWSAGREILEMDDLSAVSHGEAL